MSHTNSECDIGHFTDHRNETRSCTYHDDVTMQFLITVLRIVHGRNTAQAAVSRHYFQQTHSLFSIVPYYQLRNSTHTHFQAAPLRKSLKFVKRKYDPFWRVECCGILRRDAGEHLYESERILMSSSSLLMSSWKLFVDSWILKMKKKKNIFSKLRWIFTSWQRNRLENLNLNQNRCSNLKYSY
jgi:hypothetical protein